MKRKFLFLVLSMVVFLVGVGFIRIGNVKAQTASFAAGCTSNLGYSITTGLPCNGTSVATAGQLAGCSTALGYSITNGRPCSGGPVALSFLAGCNSIYGYSTIGNVPCNGTTVASTLTTPTPTTPGLPTTGSDVQNSILVILAAALSALGFTYLAHKAKLLS